MLALKYAGRFVVERWNLRGTPSESSEGMKMDRKLKRARSKDREREKCGGEGRE